MDILQQIRQMAQERDIPLDELRSELEEALAVAYRKNWGITAELAVRLDPSVKSGLVVDKEVVAELSGDHAIRFQISVQDARKKNPNIAIGDVVPSEIPMDSFGRIAAQTFKQVLNQKLREAELRRVHDSFSEKLGGIVVGKVTRREESNVLLQVDDRHEVELPKREQVGTDDYRPNEALKLYVLKIDESSRGFKVIVSRSHPNLLRKLLEIEVDEVAKGVVEVMSIAREPGQRSKIAVQSHDERVDPVGACVGQRGQRIQAIMEELRPEKIDVVPWSDSPRQYIINALSPAKVNVIKLDEEKKSAYVVVPDSQLSLAIGRGGQNVRLAARLTDWKIDIRSEQQATEEAADRKKQPPTEAVSD